MDAVTEAAAGRLDGVRDAALYCDYDPDVVVVHMDQEDCLSRNQ